MNRYDRLIVRSSDVAAVEALKDKHTAPARCPCGGDLEIDPELGAITHSVPYCKPFFEDRPIAAYLVEVIFARSAIIWHSQRKVGRA